MHRQYLSIDIGGTTIKSARIDHSGHLMIQDKRPTPRNQKQFLQSLLQIVDANSGVAAVCVSVPGIVDPHQGRVQFTGVLSYMGDFNLAHYLHEYTHLPVYVGNDANCATLAELWLGHLVGVDNGAVITLGTSVGGGIVVNGQLIHGPHFRAGELSALITNYDDPIAKERTVGATTSAVKMVAAIAHACHLPDLNDGRAAFAQVIAHQPSAEQIFQNYCERVAILIINLQAVLDLDVVLIGGGISAQPILIEEIQKQFHRLQAQDRRLKDDLRMPQIAAAKFGNEANLLGALYGLLLKLEQAGSMN